MIGFGTVINTLANNVNSISGSINTITSQYSLLSGNIDTISAQFLSLSGSVADIRSQITGSTNTTEIINPISTEDQSILDAILGSLENILIQVSTTFAEMATFMKSVVFQSTVTFEDRVTFKDKDMAGTAIISAG